MTEQVTTQGLDFELFRRAEEQHDLDLALSLYADDAELRIVDHNSPPSSPMELRGKEEIAGFLREIYGRDLTHRIENEVVGDNRIAFNEACEYPDGMRVLCAATLELRDGKIVRQVGVQAWDE